MVFKRKENELDFCQYCRWFSASVNYSEMIDYIEQEDLNIRTHRDITGEMWFGVG
jgi:hypothetical protein